MVEPVSFPFSPVVIHSQFHGFDIPYMVLGRVPGVLVLYQTDSGQFPVGPGHQLCTVCTASSDHIRPSAFASQLSSMSWPGHVHVAFGPWISWT